MLTKVVILDMVAVNKGTKAKQVAQATTTTQTTTIQPYLPIRMAILPNGMDIRGYRTLMGNVCAYFYIHE
jgi:hypothetical protein